MAASRVYSKSYLEHVCQFSLWGTGLILSCGLGRPSDRGSGEEQCSAQLKTAKTNPHCEVLGKVHALFQTRMLNEIGPK